VPGSARDTLAGAVATADGLPSPLAAAILAPARAAFTTGMHVAAGISAVVLTAVAILVVVLLRGVRPTARSIPADQ